MNEVNSEEYSHDLKLIKENEIRTDHCMKRCRFYSVYGLKKSNFELSFLQTFVLFCSFLAPRGPCEGRVILVRGLTGRRENSS